MVFSRYYTLLFRLLFIRTMILVSAFHHRVNPFYDMNINSVAHAALTLSHILTL